MYTKLWCLNSTSVWPHPLLYVCTELMQKCWELSMKQMFALFDKKYEIISTFADNFRKFLSTLNIQVWYSEISECFPWNYKELVAVSVTVFTDLYTGTAFNSSCSQKTKIIYFSCFCTIYNPVMCYVKLYIVSQIHST